MSSAIHLFLQAITALLSALSKAARIKGIIQSVHDSSHSTHLCLGMLLQLTWVTPTQPQVSVASKKPSMHPSQHPFKAWVRGSSQMLLQLTVLISITFYHTVFRSLSKYSSSANYVPGTVIDTREERVSKELY